MRRVIVVALVLPFLAACGSGGSSATPPMDSVPTITAHPTDQATTIGQTATFSVTATGTAPLAYQWMLNGVSIDGATTETYTTGPTTLGDNGATFEVAISNSAGNVTSNPAQLTVTVLPVPPAITTQPANATVAVGETATFSVTATGTAPLAYQWMLNGVSIDGATTQTYTTGPTTLGDNGGTFTVSVTNTAGTVTSNPAQLMVTALPVPPAITTQPANATVAVGETATFSVTATGTAPLAYQWMLNGVSIDGATTQTYTTGATTLGDNGATFTVSVSNAADTVTSNPAQLTVTAVPVPPAITTQPANVTVAVGQTATFSVTATGTAPLAYQWKRNGVSIGGATTRTYTTGATTLGDNGATYTVSVSNSAGTVTSNPAQLTVTVPPAITTQPANVTVAVGQTATFSVTATGTAPLSYQWTRNGSAIAGATGRSYTTAATVLGDSGAAFRVTVTNAAGAVTSTSAILTVNAPVPLVITTANLPNGVINSPYSAALQATGGTPPYTWSILSGALPAGLALSATTGTISGTPTITQAASFSIRVRDTSGTMTSAALSIVIDPAVATAPFGHIVIVLEENTNYASVIGNTGQMPYLNSLMTTYGLATNYYANTHPSIGNYFMLTTGQIVTNDDSKTPTNFPVSVDNVVRQLLANGRTWKSYAEGLPSVGYIGGNKSRYAVRHNPFPYFTDVQNNAAQLQNLVPFSPHFSDDLASGALPDYSFVVPDVCNDGHDCSLDVVDGWLSTNIRPVADQLPIQGRRPADHCVRRGRQRQLQWQRQLWRRPHRRRAHQPEVLEGRL